MIVCYFIPEKKWLFIIKINIKKIMTRNFSFFNIIPLLGLLYLVQIISLNNGISRSISLNESYIWIPYNSFIVYHIENMSSWYSEFIPFLVFFPNSLHGHSSLPFPFGNGYFCILLLLLLQPHCHNFREHKAAISFVLLHPIINRVTLLSRNQAMALLVVELSSGFLYLSKETHVPTIVSWHL